MDGFDRASDRSVTRQLADRIRAEVDQGHIVSGDPIPSEVAIMQRWSVARSTARAAVAMLRADGVVITRPGRGSFVAGTRERRAVILSPGTTAEVRPPTETERRSGHGVRVVEVRHGGHVAVYTADDVTLTVPVPGACTGP